ncbi:Sn1-specific diacylglycerol lipase beta [Achaetomium macrosporum]|uniref:sn-1-specific diacylglycerol lipase n=1 Tax=Achaetomium macrosporum TaxID=79813 RepID=A0AAN7CCG1_9PEZI|nr:Sn1-specific diacylglycerol lipase beta [Achaetomium macrosporum]
MTTSPRRAAVGADSDNAVSRITQRPDPDVEAQVPSRTAHCEAGSPLLPKPIANLVSFATRSTSFAIRTSSTIGGYGVDAAKLATLSSLELGRALFQGVLTRAIKDTNPRSNSAQAAAANLNNFVDQIALWAASGFNLTSTALSMLSDSSQVVLLTLDRFFGSTESSRAIASIISMIRREFQFPALGGLGEQVKVTDLVLAFCALAYLQRSCRSLLEDERRATRVEETIWDVVVLNDDRRLDIQEEGSFRDSTRGAIAGVRNAAPYSDQGAQGNQGDQRDHRLSMLQLEREIMMSLPDNVKVSISKEVTTSETITVNIIGDAQQCRFEPPVGVELIDEQRGNTHTHSHSEHGGQVTCSQYVLRQERRHERKMSLGKLGADAGHAAGYVEELDSGSEEGSGDGGHDTTPSRLPMLSDASAEQGAHKAIVSTSEVSTSVAASPLLSTGLAPNNDNMPSEKPLPALPGTPTLDTLTSRSHVPIQRQTSSKPLSSLDVDEFGSSSKHTERKGGFRNVLKKSMSVFHKVDSGSEAVARKKMHTFSIPQAEKAAEKVQRQPHEVLHEPSPSLTSYFAVSESIRQSTTTLAETHSIVGADVYRPASMNGDAMILGRVFEEMVPHREPDHRPPTSTSDHRYIEPQSSALYTPAVNRSVVSLVSYHPHHLPSTFSATEEALSRLTQRGTLNGMFPERHFLANITRYMRFASASYGSSFLRVLGMATEMPISTSPDDTHHELRSFAHHTRCDPSSILLSSFIDSQGGSDGTGATNTGVPLVHYISLDHQSKAVVLTCRGTLGFEDVLADMACEYDTLLWRDNRYKVHKGIHASANRLLYGGDGRVLCTLKAALEEFPDYGLILTGHSLGAAVTSLLGIMLSEPGRGPGTPFVTSPEPRTKFLSHHHHTSSSDRPHICLPAGRPIHVYAYGPPATVCTPLRNATRGLITTVVNGADIVPYLSLGLLHDFQGAALAFKMDNSHADPHISGDEPSPLKSEMWRRIRRTFLNAMSHPLSESKRLFVGGVGGSGEDEWAYSTLKALRAHMAGDKLVPPGEVFVVESEEVLRREAFVFTTLGSSSGSGEGGAKRSARNDGNYPLGRPAKRMVLKYVRDVEKRFGEVRFYGSMLTDHSPGRYEAALERLMLGVGVKE